MDGVLENEATNPINKVQVHWSLTSNDFGPTGCRFWVSMLRSKHVYVTTWPSRFLCLPARIRCMGSIQIKICKTLEVNQTSPSFFRWSFPNDTTPIHQHPSTSMEILKNQVDGPNPSNTIQSHPTPTTQKFWASAAPLAEELLEKKRCNELGEAQMVPNTKCFWCASSSPPICSI